MPYITKADHERARWMTLAEAIDWISQRDKCSWHAATLQIRKALADNEIPHLRWEDQRSPLPLREVYDDPPVGRQFWLKANIRRGRVFDPRTGRFRTLLIHKHSIFQHWPEPPDSASAASENGQATENGNVVPITKAKGGRPSAKEEIYQALDKLSHEKGHRVVKEMPRKVLPALVAKECDKQLGSRGWRQQTVQRHVQSWLKEH